MCVSFCLFFFGGGTFSILLSIIFPFFSKNVLYVIIFASILSRHTYPLGSIDFFLPCFSAISLICRRFLPHFRWESCVFIRLLTLLPTHYLSLHLSISLNCLIFRLYNRVRETVRRARPEQIFVQGESDITRISH